MLKHFLSALVASLSFSAPSFAQEPVYNKMILEILASQPSGGGHGPANPLSIPNLGKSIEIVNGNLEIRPEVSVPTFCSAATYLVFLEVLARLQKATPHLYSQETLQALLVHNQPDGTETWGRFNANGPGTARLFFETGIGRNFLEWSEAKPGDFMKIFFNDSIGKKEKGHLVIYLGTRVVDGEERVFYWSSDPPKGRGFDSMLRTKIKRWVFSRLEHPELLSNILKMPVVDPYTASLLTMDSPVEEMLEKIGLGPVVH